MVAITEAIRKAFTLRLTKYIAHQPTIKQRVFLALTPYEEVLFGGAAGPGKSDALLMAALQFVDVAGYHALILRRTYAQLSKSDGLIPRSHEWLHDTDARWNGGGKVWSFPSGATLSFGHVQYEDNKYDYQSAAYTFIGFDELTQFTESQYLYIGFSRRRRLRDMSVPLRVRSATNPPPDQRGRWVRDRFAIHKDERSGEFIGHEPNRPFVPAKISDNPYLDQEEYETALAELDPVTREQLLSGDWEIMQVGRMRKSWARYYNITSDAYQLLDPVTGRGFRNVKKRDCHHFQICDPAASAREGPGDEQIWERKMPSHTVIGTFAMTPDADLLWIDNRRFQGEVPEVQDALLEEYSKWQQCTHVGIEKSGLGIGVFQWAKRSGLPVRALSPQSQDKLVRATDFINRLYEGMVYFPNAPSDWRRELFDELFAWTGHPHEQDDQIDVAGYAGREVTRLRGPIPIRRRIRQIERPVVAGGLR